MSSSSLLRSSCCPPPLLMLSLPHNDRCFNHRRLHSSPHATSPESSSSITRERERRGPVTSPDALTLGRLFCLASLPLLVIVGLQSLFLRYLSGARPRNRPNLDMAWASSASSNDALVANLADNGLITNLRVKNAMLGASLVSTDKIFACNPWLMPPS